MNLLRLLPTSSLAVLFFSILLHPAVAQISQPADPQSENLFAIIGQVARPGVYRAPLSNPYLVDLIHNAGGFADKANGHLRIVRQTDAGTKSFFATGRDFQLQRGDVVVAGRQFELTISPQTRPSATVAQNPVAGPVQLAFVNLANRPIVLKMRPEQATVGQILELLGQSPELAGTVRVIASEETPNPTPANLQLTAGSVLVFDPAVIQANRLPDLPMNIANETTGQRGPITPVHSEASNAQAENSQSPGQLATVNPQGSSAVPPALDLEPPELTDDPLLNSTIEEPTKSPLKTASLPPRSVLPELPHELISTPDPLSPPKVAEVPVESSWLSTLMYWLLSIATFVGSSWGVVRVKQNRAKKQSSPDSANSVVNDVRQVLSNGLDEIIYDRLPVIEEPVAQSTPINVTEQSEELPEQASRVDAAHKSSGPHFMPNGAASSTRPTAPEPVVATSSPTSGKTCQFNASHEPESIRKPTGSLIRDTDHEPEGLLDRVLSRVHGAAIR